MNRGIQRIFLEEKMIKKTILVFCFLLAANMLFAGGNIERKIEKTDLSVMPGKGESEVFFDLQSSGGSVYIYMNNRFVAQCYPESDTDVEKGWLEKVVVADGSYTIEAAAVTLKSRGSKGNEEFYSSITDRKSIVCDVKSESVIIEIRLNNAGGDNKIAALSYQSRRPLENQSQEAVPEQQKAISKQFVTVAIAPFDERTGISKSDADAITEIFTAELLASKSVRIVTRANLDKVMNEMNFQMGDWSNDEKTAELGEAANADWVIRGQVTKLGSRIVVTASGLDVKTLEMTSSARMQMNDIEEAFDKMEVFVNGMVETMTSQNSEG
jgi:TolB-like protein